MTTVLGFAAITAAVGSITATPAPLNAGAQKLQKKRKAPPPKPQVIARGKVVRDARAKSGWALEVTAVNRFKTAQKRELLVQLTKTTSNPMARVMPMPEVVWQTKQKVAVRGQGSKSLRVAIPAKLAAELNKAMPPKRKAKRKAKAKGKRARNAAPPPVFAARTHYGVQVTGAS